ncbi:Aldehyde dehydrogenase NAD(P)-dependent [Penicillium alfredii]|uniref:Aldehyde dehydrogenase n=1 Tax=Penicillium alfredii TaxID=1506179 RepID=A0A9W9F349_9EURO|nr:Aldehyde dehydrogenase NAD(P)-dependent [Penicillium alfredii]KAJ5092620.1 Aldehyde dehydrogenase NAD(P)-dependent [Penicillium alfredii]
MGYSTPAEFDAAYRSTQAVFASGLTKKKEWRRHQLKRAWWMIEDNKERMATALYADLHKDRQETFFAECGVTQSDILHTLDKLDQWTQDERPARTNMLNFLGRAVVRKEPLGVTLIIGSWNFPINLLLQPMVAAIAAGCAVILKPSELAPAAQKLLREIIPKYMDPGAIRCVTAGPEEMQYVLTHRFDHIFYTGSPRIARVIQTAATKYLTPVTLELGGQAPAIVTATANIDLSAKHIAATKFMTAGQVCVNVNHVLVDPRVRDVLISHLIQHFDVFMGGRDTRPEGYTHVINEHHFDRLENLLQRTSGQIIYGGHRDRATRFFSPTIVVGVQPGDALLAEELFGPILPVVDAELNTAIAITRGMEHPLAIYGFTDDRNEQSRILNETQSGGVTFNDCMLHVAARDAPFGGIGNSGHGYHHGIHGLLAFSHLRTHIHALPFWMESLMEARYPPYSRQKTSTIAPSVTPSFDRDGKDASAMGSWSAWALGLGAVATAATCSYRWLRH